MENGYDGKLAEKLSGLAVNQHNQQHPLSHDQSNSSSNNNDSLFQVIKAVEAAEATIKQQVEENNRLRSELQRKIQELEKFKQHESMDPRYPVAPWKEQGQGSYEAHQLVPSVCDQEDMFKAKARSNAEGHSESENSKMNGSLRDDRLHADDIGISLLSSSSTRPFSPSRHLTEGDDDHGLNLSGQGLIPLAQMNNSDRLWKQELAIKIRDHEEEIMQLRRQLSDYSIKEAQICNEKYVLEKRIAYMRLAFDQQQQELVDAASKALSYRQEIIEENIRLTYALQDAHQERSTFVSSLLPLLAEYSVQPPVPDAQSIVSNVKVLFKHLQEKLLLTESKLKETQYQLTPWRSDVNHANIAPQSPPHSIGAALITSNKNSFELVPQPRYQVQTPVSVGGQTAPDWDILSHHQSGLADTGVKNVDNNELGRYSPLASRNASTPDLPTELEVTQNDTHPVLYGEVMTSRQLTFRDPVSNREVDDPNGDGSQNERDNSVVWSSGNSPYTTTTDDPSSSFSPYLPPVFEEPSSSFSEAADDDPLPAIEGLQILGDAFPGRELQACGYSINGTTSCNFEWIRHQEDGSFNYIDGAKQPNYLVTADDVDTYLAIEVQPLDDRKRKGEPVKVFANDDKKITCDLEIQNHIEKTFTSGHASYKVSVSIGYDIWEPATLTIKREGYNIKCSGPNGIVVTEKFSSSTHVVIPYGQVSELVIIGSSDVEHLLRTESNPNDASSSRDSIVLTLRLFLRRALERKRGKKKVLFFNK